MKGPFQGMSILMILAKNYLHGCRKFCMRYVFVVNNAILCNSESEYLSKFTLGQPLALANNICLSSKICIFFLYFSNDEPKGLNSGT